MSTAFKFRISAFILVMIGVVAALYLSQNKTSSRDNTETVTPLQIVSTNPNPLEEATVAPSQVIQITFNKEIAKSEFKYRLDPEVEHELEVLEGQNLGKTFKIKFIKYLEFGSGYTLFVLSNTHTEQGESLGQDYIYHFRTISYRGV